MSNTNTGVQAFPCLERGDNGLELTDGGMTLRQYAAIKLKVPDSGTDWLDEMIRKSKRDDISEKVLQDICVSVPISEWSNTRLAIEAYELANSMLKARES